MDKEHALLLTRHIKPDYAFYVQNPDRLAVAVYSSVASLVVRFSGYFLSANGEVREYALDVSPTSDRVATSQTQVFGEGFLLSCTTSLVSGNANRGQCYVRAGIQRNTGTPILPIAQLVAGYLTDDYSPSFPFGKREGPLEGPGMIRSITGTNPPATAQIGESVPTGARWRLLTVWFQLTTDANVANRFMVLRIQTGSNVVLDILSLQAQVFSLTYEYSYILGGDRAFLTSRSSISLPLPWRVLMGGESIFAFIDGVQAADNLSAPILSVEEWLEA